MNSHKSNNEVSGLPTHFVGLLKKRNSRNPWNPVTVTKSTV